MQQFNQFYFRRLEQLRGAVKEAAEMKWDARAEYVDNILDLRPGSLTVIIGTVFKEQCDKPNVFDSKFKVIKHGPSFDLSFGVNGVDGNNMTGTYINDSDQCILEDCSGRINIQTGPKFNPIEHVTGTIIALLGIADN